jgi:hypothetical protein
VTEGSAQADFPSPLFEHEIRRDGRTVATLRAVATPTGVTVESEIYPLTDPAGGEPLRRPFAFTSHDHARRFTDEALLAFEYLNCNVS